MKKLTEEQEDKLYEDIRNLASEMLLAKFGTYEVAMLDKVLDGICEDVLDIEFVQENGFFRDGDVHFAMLRVILKALEFYNENV